MQYLSASKRRKIVLSQDTVSVSATARETKRGRQGILTVDVGIHVKFKSEKFGYDIWLWNLRPEWIVNFNSDGSYDERKERLKRSADVALTRFMNLVADALTNHPDFEKRLDDSFIFSELVPNFMKSSYYEIAKKTIEKLRSVILDEADRVGLSVDVVSKALQSGKSVIVLPSSAVKKAA